jgi:hypothetical protein
MSPDLSQLAKSQKYEKRRQKAENESKILRNRELFIQERDADFEHALKLLDRIVRLFTEEFNENESRLFEDIDMLVSTLENARYYARLSIGGDNISPPESISIEERAFVDLIETMYSYSRSIRRMYRHEITLNEFAKNNEDLDDRILLYLLEIKKTDSNLILNNLKNMQKRIKTYREFISR